MSYENLAGGAWLSDYFDIQTVMPLTVISRIGSRRSTHVLDTIATQTYVENMRPSLSLRGHLTFHLKHEIPHLELLSRLFAIIDPQALVSWIADEPTGQYARRVGFLYEFLTDSTLQINAEVSGAYVEVIDPEKLVAASPGQSVSNRRWRVWNNLPGTRAFCPMVRKTGELHQAMALDVRGLLQELAQEFGDDVLMRSAVWMTLRESKSSFSIEGEAGQSDRIQRFADVMARRTGEGPIALEASLLAALQAEILGTRTSLQQFGIRQSPVFVGEVLRYSEVVHYVAPPPQDLLAMLEGLRIFLERTEGQSSVMRSAVAAFGFVYIHPLADGNGRVHRFLVNDILRRDGVVQHPMILPISSLIARAPAEQRAYDRILDEISRPLMRSLANSVTFADTQTHYPDGISSNFEFSAIAYARHAWRFLDLTPHTIYLADVLERTIREDMQEESRYLRSHAQARAAIKDIIEMPDMQIDRVIRSAEANQGKLSNLLAKEIPALAQPVIWQAIQQAIENAFHQAD